MFQYGDADSVEKQGMFHFIIHRTKMSYEKDKKEWQLKPFRAKILNAITMCRLFIFPNLLLY